MRQNDTITLYHEQNGKITIRFSAVPDTATVQRLAAMLKDLRNTSGE